MDDALENVVWEKRKTEECIYGQMREKKFLGVVREDKYLKAWRSQLFCNGVTIQMGEHRTVEDAKYAVMRSMHMAIRLRAESEDE